jgi:uncharacterized protein YprB with RNaseH-like and TPR domain
MIQNSFILLDGVGYKTEEKLWRQDVLSWDDFLEIESVIGISSKQKSVHDRELEAASHHLDKKSPYYFSQRLKMRDYWRLYSDFKEDACFLDIETTGLSSESALTVVGIFDGRNTKSFVKGDNLIEAVLKEELSKYRLIVTFFGSAFDIPFIKAKYPGIAFDIPHIDLCFASRRIGLRGGLKSIEKQLGFDRGEGIAEIDGLEAVRLWRRWERYDDEEALARLLEYNKADVVNLKILAEKVYEGLKAKTFKDVCG